MELCRELSAMIPEVYAVIKQRKKNITLEYQKLKVIEEICELWDAIYSLDIKKADLDAIESINHSRSFCGVYREYLEGGVQSELADCFIALMTYCGEAKIDTIRKLDIQSKVHPEWFVKLIYKTSKDFNLDELFSILISFSQIYQVDIIRHIRLKMRYNANRRDWHE